MASRPIDTLSEGPHATPEARVAWERELQKGHLTDATLHIYTVWASVGAYEVEEMLKWLGCYVNTLSDASATKTVKDYDVIVPLVRRWRSNGIADPELAQAWAMSGAEEEHIFKLNDLGVTPDEFYKVCNEEHGNIKLAASSFGVEI